MTAQPVVSESSPISPLNDQSLGEATKLLEAIQGGHSELGEQFFALVYHELRRLASSQIRLEKPGQTLTPTALVHEAYLRLFGTNNPLGFANRRHFFGAAAEAMRRILVDVARRKGRQKRNAVREYLDIGKLSETPERNLDLIGMMDEAISRLSQADPVAGELVRLRYFIGLSLPQISQTMDIPLRSLERIWQYARAFLASDLHNETPAIE